MRQWHKLGGGAWYLIADGTPADLLHPEDIETFPPLVEARAENERLREALDEAQLRSIEARNPGIDMDEVRRSRAAASLSETGGEPARVDDGRVCPASGASSQGAEVLTRSLGTTYRVRCPHCDRNVGTKGTGGQWIARHHRGDR